MVFLRVGPWAHSYWLLLPEAMFQLWQEVTTGVGKVWMWFLGPGPAQEAILPLSAWSRDPCPYLDSDPNYRSCPTGACAASQVPTLHAKLLRKFYSTSSLKICCYWVKLFKIHHIIPRKEVSLSTNYYKTQEASQRSRQTSYSITLSPGPECPVQPKYQKVWSGSGPARASCSGEPHPWL